ncbi:MAG: hypothetical protein LAT67_05800 [Balneolales bacterium]|nr:hypothetical protein [Balneolales bacterium]
MKFESINWQSPSLGSKVTVRVAGNAGTPVIILADTEYIKNEALLAEKLAYQIKEDHNVLIIVPAELVSPIFDTTVKPESRLVQYLHVESFITDELIPRLVKDYSNNFIILAGVGRFAYVAANLVFRFPEKVGKLISISGLYDMRPGFNGAESVDYYYNNPVEYLPHLNEESILKELTATDIRIVSHKQDPNKFQAESISDFLNHKSIYHDLDVWGDETTFCEETFSLMLAKHVP